MSVRPLAPPRRCDPAHGSAVRLRFRVVHGPQHWDQLESPRLTRTSMREGREHQRRQPVLQEAPLLHFHENIDRAVTIEMRPRGVPRGVNLQAYHYVRATGPPLSHQIAHALLAQPDSHIGFLAGMVFPPHLPHGEIDGPIGSAVLGHSLTQLGHRVSILVEEPVLPVMEALVQVLGADQLRLINASAVDDGDWDTVADDLGAVIAIEKLGSIERGSDT